MLIDSRFARAVTNLNASGIWCTPQFAFLEGGSLSENALKPYLVVIMFIELSIIRMLFVDCIINIIVGTVPVLVYCLFFNMSELLKKCSLALRDQTNTMSKGGMHSFS